MLQQHRFLILDCQTTGMHPSLGEMLEIAWCFTSASDLLAGVEPEIHSALIETGRPLPWRVQEITGLRPSDFDTAISLDDARTLFVESLAAEGATWAVIHYAQFERAFLEHFLGTPEGLPFQILCTHMIAKRLFPQAPSRNIRALSGFLGAHLGDVKRASDHVRATLEIWKGLQSELSTLPVATPEELLQWSKSAATKRKKVSNASYEYRVDRAKRLALPDRPGVYRMLSKTGRILYVGKATSLKDRVNSYFRGKRGRDPRKLEMMAQTWDLQVTECSSALEAAVLESDEIKRHDPPYNVSLKGGRRRLLFYDRDFDTSVASQDATHRLGPFRAMNPIEDIKQLIDWQRLGPGVIGGGGHLFYGLYEDHLVQEGYVLFLARHPRASACGENVRAHLAFGLSLERAGVQAGDEEFELEMSEDLDVEDAAAAESDDDIEVTPDEMADKFERMYLRAAHALRRTHLINKLMNARVTWQENDQDFELTVCGGHVVRASGFASMQAGLVTQAAPLAAKRVSWSSLGVADYDRLSVLASELNARNGRIEMVMPAAATEELTSLF